MKVYKLFVLAGASLLFVLGLSGLSMSQHTNLEGDVAKATFAGGCFWCMEHPFDELDGVIRNTSETAYHPSCTNKMGIDNMSVVDPETKVYGIANLRVVDSSIMPDIVSSNINASTVMIGEKGADLIKDDYHF